MSRRRLRRGTATAMGRFVVRTAFEHSSPESLSKYLKKHPRADKSKHTVKGEGNGEGDEPGEKSAPKAIKIKRPKITMKWKFSEKITEAKKKYGKELKKAKQQAKKELGTYEKEYITQLDQKVKDEQEWAEEQVKDVEKEMKWTDEEFLENMKPHLSVTGIKPNLEQLQQRTLKDLIKEGELPKGSSLMDMAKKLNAQSKQGHIDDAKEDGFDDPVEHIKVMTKKGVELEKGRIAYAKKQWKAVPEEQKLTIVAAPKAAQAYVDAMDEPTRKEYKRVIDAWESSSSTPEAHQLQGYFDTFGGIEGDSADEDLEGRTNTDCNPACVRKNREIGKTSDKLREFAEESYAYTQAFYEEMGVKELTLWRGTNSQADGKAVGEDIDLQTREVSSWSTSSFTASKFGRVIEIKVPVEKVFASAATFPDFDWEEEVMVMGAGSVKGHVDSPQSIKAAASRRAAKKIRFTPEDEDWLKNKPKSFRERWEKKMKKKRKRRGSVSRRGTKTRMARELVAESADDSYKRLKRDIDQKLKRLDKAMTKHDKEQKANPENWGFVGDYGHVEETLDELVRFLNG